jgi:hypothetical protein
MNALALFFPVAKRRDLALTLVLPERAAQTRPPRRRLLCHWRRDQLIGRLVCAWSAEDAEEARMRLAA